MGWCRALLISSFLLACSTSEGPELPAEPAPAVKPSSSTHRTVAAVEPGPRRQPKPGERVRQPELDGYCADDPRPLAFYYHGGSPVTKVARKDRCMPLYLSDCESEDDCYPPRDQEPGMWCCGVPAQLAQGEVESDEAAAALQQARR